MTSKTEYTRRISAGLCVKCAEDLNGSPFTRCLPCHQAFKKGRKSKKHLLAQKGLCVLCQNPAASSPNGGLYKYCQECLDKRKLEYQKHKDQRQCVDCRQPANDTRCQTCAEKRTLTPLKTKILNYWGGKCQTCQGENLLNLIPTEQCSEAIKDLRGEKLFLSVFDQEKSVARVNKNHCRIVCNTCYREESKNWCQQFWDLYKPKTAK